MKKMALVSSYKVYRELLDLCLGMRIPLPTRIGVKCKKGLMLPLLALAFEQNAKAKRFYTLKPNAPTRFPVLLGVLRDRDDVEMSKNMIEAKMKSEKKQIEAFHKSMESEFKKDETAMAMQHIKWAFFPIIAHHHYYLVVFNLFKGTSVIIDNSISGATYDSKYKHVCDLLKNLFSKHLERYKLPKASDVRDKKTTIMKLKWGTKNNEVDCGVFGDDAYGKLQWRNSHKMEPWIPN
ncbi:ulp1 protease family, C-terminal catalytic domain-containing protein [Artemisia annua]|uniref:Ulp1 protease family, C-terminal catalytic domain-containing protein n=1 Tax=Artemisia annua TaxID=35608 RepID=A0A2U1MYA3_ARTAN|nr:ulp1 protease family, C-terminal catalytic domain-containing protein [Artemisia annua]